MTSIKNSDLKVKDTSWNCDAFSNRLLSVIKDESITSFAVKSGFGESLLRKYLSGTTPGADKLLAMAKAAEVSLDWLVTGEETSNQAIKQPDNNYSNDPEWNEYSKIPLYDVEVSAGHGSHLNQEKIKDGIAFKKDWLLSKGFQEKNLATITAKGDSMEPNIKNGDILLVNLLNTSMADDGIYVLRYDGHLFAKRLQLMFNGELHIKSDNDTYTTQIVKPENTTDLQIIGKVVWVGHEM